MESKKFAEIKNELKEKLLSENFENAFSGSQEKSGGKGTTTTTTTTTTSTTSTVPV